MRGAVIGDCPPVGFSSEKRTIVEELVEIVSG